MKKKNPFTLGVFIDVSKSFSTVDLYILIKKINQYTVKGNNIPWFKSYIHNHKKWIKFNLFIYSFILFIYYLFIYLFIHSFILFIYLFYYLFIYLFYYLFIYLFIYSLFIYYLFIYVFRITNFGNYICF